MLVFEFDFGVFDQSHDSLVINQDVTTGRRTLNRLAGTFIHDFGGKIFSPTRSTVNMAAFHTSHHLEKRSKVGNTDFYAQEKCN